jgi:predicted Zn-ribbon and HTH transcriptional regulator
MVSADRTPRQRLIEVLTGARLAAHQLAQLVGIPERQVEEHLEHVVKSVSRDRTRRFILEPARCQECGFVFRDRRKLTRPSRCPHCKSEGVIPPRYGVDVEKPHQPSSHEEGLE